LRPTSIHKILRTRCSSRRRRGTAIVDLYVAAAGTSFGEERKAERPLHDRLFYLKRRPHGNFPPAPQDAAARFSSTMGSCVVPPTSKRRWASTDRRPAAAESLARHYGHDGREVICWQGGRDGPAGHFRGPVAPPFPAFTPDVIAPAHPPELVSRVRPGRWRLIGRRVSGMAGGAYSTSKTGAFWESTLLHPPRLGMV